MSFFTGAIIGFVAGWIIFKRPQWATDAIAWLRAKVGVQ